MLDPYEVARILALQAVLKNTPEYSLRKIFRWYSQHCCTPLHIVETLPIEDVLEHYYEAQYEQLKDNPELLEEEIDDLTMTEEQRKVKAMEEEKAKNADEDWFQSLKEEAKTSLDKTAVPKAEPLPTTTPVNAPTALGGNTTSLGDTGTTTPKMSLPEADLPVDTEAPPDIKMEFISEEELEDLSAWDLFGPPPKADK